MTKLKDGQIGRRIWFAKFFFIVAFGRPECACAPTRLGIVTRHTQSERFRIIAIIIIIIIERRACDLHNNGDTTMGSVRRFTKSITQQTRLGWLRSFFVHITRALCTTSGNRRMCCESSGTNTANVCLCSLAFNGILWYFRLFLLSCFYIFFRSRSLPTRPKLVRVSAQKIPHILTMITKIKLRRKPRDQHSANSTHPEIEGDEIKLNKK